MRTYNEKMNGKKILLGAHRGDRFHCPENTMAAFRAAVEMGCDAIETDVRMTKDGHLVLIHDRDVVRTTNGQGFVDEMTLAELRALDAGFWKDPSFAGERIPTVEEFLEYVSKTDLLINWELKEYPRDFGEERAYATVDALVELIDKYGMASRSIMNSFSELLLEYVDRKWPHRFSIHGYIDYNKPKDHATRPLESFLDWAAIWHKDEAHTTGFAEDYAFARERDLMCCILVKDFDGEYRRALDMGCTMFTSDNPAEAIEILRRLGVRSDK
jgi:glycerophosphoryl diester phosphodiesterase